MKSQSEQGGTETSGEIANPVDAFVMPLQPIIGHRFVENKIVTMLLDTHPNMDMNSISTGDFSDQERTQFSQLIGYSLNGFSELSYVDDEAYEAALIISETGESEAEARSVVLRAQMEDVRKGLKYAAIAAFRIHPDDLRA